MIKLGLMFITTIIVIYSVCINNIAINDYDHKGEIITKKNFIPTSNIDNNNQSTKNTSLQYPDKVTITGRIDTKFTILTMDELKIEESYMSQLISDEEAVNRLNSESYSSEERYEMKNLLIHLGKVRTRMIDLSMIKLKNKIDHYKYNNPMQQQN